MHDATGLPLQVGDRVLVPAIVTQVSRSADYCNVSIETVAGRRPDGQKEHINAINTGVLYRANDSDPAHQLSIDLFQAEPHPQVAVDDFSTEDLVARQTTRTPIDTFVQRPIFGQQDPAAPYDPASANVDPAAQGAAAESTNTGGPVPDASHDEDHGGTPHDD